MANTNLQQTLAHQLTQQHITARYNTFMGNNKSICQRYASYDLCYFYFYTNRGNLLGNNLQTSCMQLWSFLGSWGMITRGNALQGTSYAFLVPVIEYINNNPQYYQLQISNQNYCRDILQLYNDLKTVINIPQLNQKTLITKIILGVYGCLPAFDSFVCGSLGIHTQGDLSLKNVCDVVSFYNTNRNLINTLANQTYIKVFYNNNTKVTYTPAKIIDMILFTRP